MDYGKPTSLSHESSSSVGNYSEQLHNRRNEQLKLKSLTIFLHAINCRRLDEKVL